MNIYLTDGSSDCFYTAVFAAYSDKNCTITSAKNLQLEIGAKAIPVQPDAEKCERVKKKIRSIDAQALSDISLLLRRGCAAKEDIALQYIRLLIKENKPVRDMLASPIVINAVTEIRKVTLEVHRFTGFLRFMEGANGIFYAPFAPDNDILDLLVPHFIKRLSAQPFVIHDTSRNKAALYNTKDCVIAQTDEKVSVLLSEYEKGFQQLWKEYYSSVNILQRPHEKQMRGYMPVRYWKFMPEKNQPL